MTNLREAAKQALERLRKYHHGNGFVEDAECIAALEAALAQQDEPAQKPVAVHQFRKQYCANWYDGHPDHTDGGGPYEERTLYTAPPQRKPLTKEEIMRAFYAAEKPPMSIRHGLSVVEAARIVEKAHGIVTCGDTKERA